MEALSFCPVCGEPGFTDFLKSKDFFLTQEEFQILECIHCGFKFLNPRPDRTGIGRFYESVEYISHDTRGKNILNSLYKIVRKFSVRRKFKLIKMLNPGEKLLDIGCGTGEFIHYCGQHGMSVQGIEPGEKPRNFATSIHRLDVRDEAFLDELSNPEFDIITMWHVLEHVHGLNERMEKINKILKPEGTLVIAVPNIDSWDANHYRKFWAAYDLPRHLYHFSQTSITLLAKNHGYFVEKIIPLKLDAFYICLMSEKYATGKRNYFKALVNGARSNSFAWRNNKNYSSLIFVLKKGKNEK